MKLRSLRKIPLHWQIIAGMALGLLAGLLANLTGQGILAAVGDGAVGAGLQHLIRLNDFVGAIFIRGLRFIAVPIVLFSIIAGAASMDDVKKLGRIGGRTMALYLGTTAVAISIGLVFANVLRPGLFVSAATRDSLALSRATEAATRIEKAQAPDIWATLLDIVPSNPFASLAQGRMLQVVFTALVIGVALTALPKTRAKPIIDIANTMTDVIIKLVNWVMKLAPIAVFALLAKVVATTGLDVLGALALYTLVVILGLATMVFGVYPAVLKWRTGMPIRLFFRAIAPAQLLAFSSSSSSATLPVTMECAEDGIGVRPDLASFVLPLGATINMDGTALYQGVATVFIAQLYGVDLTLADQLTIVLTATLASVGTAGVPGVGLIMLVIVLQSVGMPPAAMAGGIAIIFGVDRILDMCRTTCNVTGDLMVATVVAHSEGALDPAKAHSR